MILRLAHDGSLRFGCHDCRHGLLIAIKDRSEVADLMPRAKKRPAAAVPLAPGGADDSEPWWVPVVGAHDPAWAFHCIRVLGPHFEKLKQRMGDRIHIVCWSDCGGLGSELFALGVLATSIEEHLGVSIEITPYAFCDSSAPARQFAALNHKPRHIITDMMDRDFEARTCSCHMWRWSRAATQRR